MAKVPRKTKKNGYVMPDPLPLGEVLQDLAKRKWVLGPSIGKGGFGEIYSAKEYSASSKSSKYPYAVKIEPHANGPLFVEMHFCMRVAKPDDVNEYKLTKKLKSFGMPKCIGFGSHEYKKDKYRFLVMEKFGSDIWKLFLENNRKFPLATIYKIGIQILHVLEYIHSKGYVHADIKGANILLEEGSDKQVYLIDFGLATRYSSVLKPDPKQAHNGTIEYTSRDAHLGVQTRRGDLEVLAYNLLQWVGCLLPWEKISNPVTVQNSKIKYMSDLKDLFKKCLGSEKPPVAIEKFFKYVVSLEISESPDYECLRKILLKGLEEEKVTVSSPLIFTTTKKTPVKRKAVKETIHSPNNDQDENHGKKPKEVKKKLTKPKGKKVKDVEVKKVKDEEVKEEEEVDEINSDPEKLNDSQILTQEMKRLKEKMEQRKANAKKPKTKVTNGRVLRSSDKVLNNEEENGIPAITKKRRV